MHPLAWFYSGLIDDVLKDDEFKTSLFFEARKLMQQIFGSGF
jgi:hypothetical protein